MIMGFGHDTLDYADLAGRLVRRAWIALLALATLFSWSCSTQAAEPVSSAGKVLFATYVAIKASLDKNQYGIPLYLESKEEYSTLHVDVYGVIEYPFGSVRDALLEPGNWCDINSLLFNIKASTFRKVSDQWMLTLYSGRKYYQPPEDAYKLDFRFSIDALQPDYMAIALTADNGPLFTKDHRIRVEALPLDRSTTFIHFRYDYRYGAMARAAIKSYYATIGRGKKGFSIISGGKTANPVYVGSVRGSVERNAVRYYLAIQTYLDMLALPRSQRFEKRISRWYDLTARFPRQLYEMDKVEYLANKRLEHANQLLLQIETGR